jgi:hypothetical protein
MKASLTLSINSTIVRAQKSWWAVVRAYFAIVSRRLPGFARRQAERMFTLPPPYAGRSAHPVDARRETVVAGKRSLAVRQTGPATAPAVLLVHGWGGHGREPSVVGAVVDFVTGNFDAMPAELPVLPRPAPIY